MPPSHLVGGGGPAAGHRRDPARRLPRSRPRLGPRQASSGAPVLLATGDGGVSWSPRRVPEGNLELMDVVFTDDTHAGWRPRVHRSGRRMAVEGIVLSPSDGGATGPAARARPGARRPHVGPRRRRRPCLRPRSVDVNPVVFASGDDGASWVGTRSPAARTPPSSSSTRSGAGWGACGARALLPQRRRAHVVGPQPERLAPCDG